MRHHPRVDRNQKEIVEALRKACCSVQSLASVGQGCPDLLVGVRGQNFLLEVKDPKQPLSGRALTPGQKLWHGTWLGSVVVVETVDAALAAVGVVP